MPITFDGPNKVITLASADTSVTVAEVYSRWKDWAATTDNAKFLPAFRAVGGDPLGGGLQAGINVFLRNDLGWRIKPPEENIIIQLSGNLYAEDPVTPVFIPTTGGFDTLIRLDLSANLLQIVGAGTSAAIAEAVMNEAVEAGFTVRQALRVIAAATAGKVSGAETTTITFRNAKVDDTDRIVATVDTDGNRTDVVLDLD